MIARALLLVAVLGGLTGPFAAGYMLARGRQPGADLSPLLAKLDQIADRTDTQAAKRCMVIETRTLNIDVTTLPSLGVHKVSPPDNKRASLSRDGK